MDRNKLNQSEWENPQNWAGPRWLSVYFSKNDSRTCVPKQIPEMGWTVNLGKTAGVLWLAGVLVGLPLLMLLVVVVTEAGG